MKHLYTIRLLMLDKPEKRPLTAPLRSVRACRFILIALIIFLSAFRLYAQEVLWGMNLRGGTDQYGTIGYFDPVTSSWTTEHNFTTKFPGRFPVSDLIEANGKFYGTAEHGGAHGHGLIFEWDPLTNTYSSKVDFTGLDGRYPLGSLTYHGGKFYGMTQQGGTHGYGVIFEWDPFANTYSKKVDFNLTDGANPQGSLTYNEGKFYGMTHSGGSYNSGVIFEWDPTANMYNKKIDFNGANGAFPFGDLTYNGGKFYGMTLNGGSAAAGVIFEWDPAVNTYVKKIDFIGANGAHPVGSLTYNNGKFYGMTRTGGSNSIGVIFEWSPSTNAYVKKVDFGTSIGSYPHGSLTYSNDKFYGITSSGGSGSGVIFEWDPATNTYNKKVDLSVANGQNSQGSLTLNGGKFYGMTRHGGSDNAGVIFEWNPSTNVYSKKVDFSRTNGSLPFGSLTYNEGKLYGMTREGGSQGRGVIFEWDPSAKTYTAKVDFNGSDGMYPQGSLTYNGGRFYGMTERGGAYGYGVIFEWDPSTNTYIKRFEFNNTNGAFPQGSLTYHDGKFYGMTREGGLNGLGVIFLWDPLTNTYTEKINLSGINGSSPSGSLTYNAGKFYGMTREGGLNNLGVIFEWDPLTNLYNKKFDFNVANGSLPNGSLTYNGDKFYGMTRHGGSSNAGVIFEWDPSTNVYSKKVDFSFTNGILPFGSLTYSGGKFYGTTSLGGFNSSGVVFEWDPATNVYSKKVDLSVSTGTNPQFSQLLAVGSTAVENTILISSVHNDLCLTSAFNIEYSITGTFSSSNTFTAQLSDASGNFAAPTDIGTIRSATSGTIIANLPSTIPPGTGYRIRLISADPLVMGTDNGSDIAIHGLPAATLSGDAAICPGTTTNLSITLTGSGPWSGSYFDEVTHTPFEATTSPLLIPVSPEQNTAYTLTAVNDANCPGTVDGGASITLGSLPVLSVPDPISINNEPDKCAAEVFFSATATGTPASTFTFSIGETFPITSPYQFPVGTTTVMATATNGCGNDTRTFAVTVTDIQKPAVVTQNLIVPLNENGTATITPAQVNNGSTDNCSIPSDGYALSQTSFDCTQVGDHTITLTVTDINGNMGSATAIVTVQDKIEPLVVTQNLTVQLNENGTAIITPSQINNGSIDNCSIPADGYALSQTSFDCTQVGDHTVTLTVTDINSNMESATAIVTVQDKIEPLVVTQNLTVQLNENGTATITPSQVNNGSTDNCSIPADGYALSQTSFDCTQVGDHTVTLTVTDINSNIASATAIITVQDKTAPVPVLATLPLLTGECGFSVSIMPAAMDNCKGNITATTSSPLTYNEQGTYTIQWIFNDGNGNTTEQRQTIVVNNTAPVINSVVASLDPKPVGMPVLVNISFTDNNVTAGSIHWGDGNSTGGIFTENVFKGEHAYASPGVYTLEITLKDACGGIANSLYQYVVIYDPYGGFVTGGGWYTSPAGAYVMNAEATGKASFGFVSKYKKGSTVPEGNTDFQFQAGGLKFKSTAYEWLVIAGHKAMFKGVGDLNGVSGYGFLITAVDGAKKSTASPDKFRIKIWDAAQAVVYDNQMNAGDDAEATTMLGGGSIVIHDGRSTLPETAGNTTPENIRESITSAYPNPFLETITIEYNSSSEDNINMQLLDVTGKTIYDQNHAFNEQGIYSVRLIEENQKRSGLYILKINQGRMVKFLKLMRK